MANTYSSNLKLATPAPGDVNWNLDLDANRAILDRQNAIGGLAVTTHEPVSASLLVDVSAGLFLNGAGVVVRYPGTSGGVAIAASSTTSLYLTALGALAQSIAGFPGPPTTYVPLAVVVAGSTSISSITDARVALTITGSANLPLAGGMLADGANIGLGTTAGTKIGTAANQKLGLFGATPVVQPTMGPATAGAAWTANEVAMLNAVYAAMRAIGGGS